jgi:serine/threonine protein kinase
VDTVGAYRLLRQIGEGGMGVVHLALARDGSRVAVKILRPQVIGGREARQRLEREVAAMRRVRSPRVAECVDADPWGDPPFVVTQYVPGLSLTEYVAEYGPLDAARLHRFALGTAEALAGVHAAGVLHRDIKPSNVLIFRDEPVLIDFGLAMSGDESRMTHAGWVFGTPAYLAPEVVLGDTPTPAVDVHGWASTVTFAATGRSPYGSGPSVVVLDRIRRGEFSIGGVPDPIATVLRRCLSPEPHQRPTAPELCRWLEQLGAVAHAGPTLQVPVMRSGGATTTAAGAPTSSMPAAPDMPISQVPTTAPAAASMHSVGHPWGPPPPPATRPGHPPAPLHPPMPAPPASSPPSESSTWTRLLQWLSGFATAALMAAAVAIAPYATAVLVLLAIVAIRAGFSTADRRRRLQARRGPRGRDGPMSVLVWPLQALYALPLAILACVVSLAGAVALSAIQSTLGRGAGAATVIGGIAFAVMLWFGPAHVTLRRAGGMATRTMLIPPAAGVVTLLVLATVAVILLVVANDSPTSWFPLDQAPWKAAGG